jgi:uncharacterized membrane protein YjjP (DUF1212 family)
VTRSAPATDERASAELQPLLLALGVALTMTGDAVSEVQRQLGAIADAYGYPRARISVLPTMLIVALDDGRPAGLRTIDSSRELRLDQASEVIHLARAPRAGGSRRPRPWPSCAGSWARTPGSGPPRGSSRTAC